MDRPVGHALGMDRARLGGHVWRESAFATHRQRVVRSRPTWTSSVSRISCGSLAWTGIGAEQVDYSGRG